MEVNLTSEGFIRAVPNVAQIDAPVLAEDADALEGFLAGVRDQVRKIDSDRKLSEEGRVEARQSAGKAALVDIEAMGKAHAISGMERDLEGISQVGNPLHLLLDGKAADGQTKAVMGELRSAIRARLEAEPDETARQLKAEVLVGQLIEDGEDLALASLFDAHAQSPMLCPVSKEILDDAAETLFRKKSPAAVQRRGELEAALAQLHFNRNQARRLVTEITGCVVESEPVVF